MLHGERSRFCLNARPLQQHIPTWAIYLIPYEQQKQLWHQVMQLNFISFWPMHKTEINMCRSIAGYASSILNVIMQICPDSGVRKKKNGRLDCRIASCNSSKVQSIFSVTITYIFDEHLFFLIHLTILACPVIRLDYTS
jgi:hypothetical protein